MSLIHLSDRAIVSVTGADASSFLQGLITNDIRKLAADKFLYAALLTPQGKFLHDFLMVEHRHEVWLECETSRVEDLIKRLGMYKLRAKVEFASLPHLQIYAALEAPQEHGLALRDPRHPELGWRLITAEPVDPELPWQAWEHHRLQLAIPDGSRDFIPERSFLLEFGMEALHGVDFNKGCYVGQEVTARSKFRGAVKKCLHQVTLLEGTMPPPGTPIHAGASAIGELRSSLGALGLAVLRIQETDAAQTQGLRLHAGDAVIAAKRPEWFPAISAEEN